MLILSRKAQQTIQIGENIQLTVLGIQGNRVKIGLEAPESVQILRGEVINTDPAGGADGDLREMAD